MQINRCPKCGREPDVLVLMDADYDIEGYLFGCPYCDLYTGCCETENESIAKWNEMTEEMK